MYIRVKRILDLISSLVLLIFVTPILVVSMILIFIEINENPLFVQQRPGYKGQIFKIYKLKTMRTTKVNDCDENRITAIGGILRKLSIDELPQLLNILKGEMSFVGPRPLLVEYLELYTDEEKRRHDVLPGITGWAQVNGRNNLKWKEKFIYDIFYVDNISALLDCKIVVLTISKVLKAKDISQDGFATVDNYNGKN